MNLKTQKIISVIFVGACIVLGLEALVYIMNLNQIGAYIHLAFWIWIFLAVIMALWYDLHFKNPGAVARAKARHESVTHWLKRFLKIWMTAFWDRFEHFRRWKYFKHWQNYLLLPGLTFWATVTILYLNIGPWNWKIQQVFIALSSAAMIVNFWYLKEIFRRRKDSVDNDIFIALSVVKIYTAGLLFGAGLGILRPLCDWRLYAALVFSLTFLLVYQALFQHRLMRPAVLGFTMVLAAIMGVIAYFVYQYWGYNFYTAAIFMAACYNFCWGLFHYYLDRSLTRRAFVEILVVSLLIGFMVLQATNFKASILGVCG